MEKEKRHYNQVMRVGIIGAGNMATAILSGIAGTHKSASICCSDISQKQLSKIKTTNKVKTTKDNTVAIKKSTIVFLCVKPNIIEKVAKEIRPFLKPSQIVISVAAGVTMKNLEASLGKNRKIIRTMPNLPCLIRKGVVAVMANKNCTPKDKKMAEKLISSIGKLVSLRRERDFDCITALSGSGPAFFAQYIRSNLEFAKSKKINSKEARLLVFETLSGTLEFLQHTRIELKDFISMVASPGGTTEEGLKTLKNRNYNKIVRFCLEAAAEKSSKISAGTKLGEKK